MNGFLLSVAVYWVPGGLVSIGGAAHPAVTSMA